MTPDERFLRLPKNFWSLVRLIGQECGYTKRGKITIPTLTETQAVLSKLGLTSAILNLPLSGGRNTWDTLLAYFTHRQILLHESVEPNLMDALQAKAEFSKLRKELKPKCPLPMNKQKGAKKAPAFLTGMVNMLIEAHSSGHCCNYNPLALTTVASGGRPLRTLARRMDGAFPSVINPIAVWEVKEYYYTTTFGSRVADGVYETLLDGMEIEELAAAENINILHYLMIDAHYTWWKCGKTYLCRIVDMLHMGYVDEVLVGREVISRLPVLVKMWLGKLI
jgi:hypothetical protein